MLCEETVFVNNSFSVFSPSSMKRIFIESHPASRQFEYAESLNSSDDYYAPTSSTYRGSFVREDRSLRDVDRESDYFNHLRMTERRLSPRPRPSSSFIVCGDHISHDSRRFYDDIDHYHDIKYQRSLPQPSIVREDHHMQTRRSDHEHELDAIENRPPASPLSFTNRLIMFLTIHAVTK